MKRRLRLVRITALLTLGGGVVNLVSLLFPHWPRRGEVVLEVFPLEFLHISRFLTLIIGFSLVVSSFAIYRRKKMAYRAVLVLAAASALFHLTRGLDYEQALYSLVMIGALVAARREFTVRSEAPALHRAVVRLAVAAVVALAYGVAGFWLLDRRDFGVNFHLRDAADGTIRVMLLARDLEAEPRTRHARWFLDSLHLMTYATLAYGLFALYRPVVYRLRTVPRDHLRAVHLLDRYGRTALDYFKASEDKSIFLSASREAFVGYRVAGRYAIVLGDPVGPEGEIEGVVGAFLRYCQDNDWIVAFHQALPDFLPIYQAHGLHKLKIGDDAVVELSRFSLDGKEHKRLRNRLRRLQEDGLRFERWGPPIPDAGLAELREVSDAWLRIEGRRERRFTVGHFDPSYLRSTVIVAIRDGTGRLLAFGNIIPSYRRGESTIDLMRYRPDAPNGVMDALFAWLLEDCRARGFERFSLGMAPMAGFQEKEEATREERAVHRFFQRLNVLFSYRGLRQFKAKYATLWEARYIVYPHVFQLPGVALALRRVSEFER